jgi:hypothetical protein
MEDLGNERKDSRKRAREKEGLAPRLKRPVVTRTAAWRGRSDAMRPVRTVRVYSGHAGGQPLAQSVMVQ